MIAASIADKNRNARIAAMIGLSCGANFRELAIPDRTMFTPKEATRAHTE